MQYKIQGLGEGETNWEGPTKVQDTHSYVFDTKLYGYFHEIIQGPQERLFNNIPSDQ